MMITYCYANCAVLYTGANIAQPLCNEPRKEYCHLSHPDSTANYAPSGSQPCRAVVLSGFRFVIYN